MLAVVAAVVATCRASAKTEKVAGLSLVWSQFLCNLATLKVPKVFFTI